MAIFNSYVKLPEGTRYLYLLLYYIYIYIRITDHDCIYTVYIICDIMCKKKLGTLPRWWYCTSLCGSFISLDSKGLVFSSALIETAHLDIRLNQPKSSHVNHFLTRSIDSKGWTINWFWQLCFYIPFVTKLHWNVISQDCPLLISLSSTGCCMGEASRNQAVEKGQLWQGFSQHLKHKGGNGLDEEVLLTSFPSLWLSFTYNGLEWGLLVLYIISIISHLFFSHCHPMILQNYSWPFLSSHSSHSALVISWFHDISCRKSIENPWIFGDIIWPFVLAIAIARSPAWCTGRYREQFQVGLQFTGTVAYDAWIIGHRRPPAVMYHVPCN